MESILSIDSAIDLRRCITEILRKIRRKMNLQLKPWPRINLRTTWSRPMRTWKKRSDLSRIASRNP